MWYEWDDEAFAIQQSHLKDDPMSDDSCERLRIYRNFYSSAIKSLLETPLASFSRTDLNLA
jgi:hypothetical protein